MDVQDRGPEDIKRWRKSERERLIAVRLAIDPALRRAHDLKITAGLDKVLGDVRGHIVGVYWPFRGEPNLHGWMAALAERGAQCALPLVVEKRAPLSFRLWRPGCEMARGIWNIPFPADGAETVPDVVIAPVVGFDAARYRLGYGGGYYDRTLAALAGKSRAVGIGYSAVALPTIHPLPHDIPMEAIVTEQGIQA